MRSRRGRDRRRRNGQFADVCGRRWRAFGAEGHADANDVAEFAEVDIDVGLTAVVTVAAVVGSVVGSVVGRRVQPEMLRKGFAVFVAVLAVLMIGRQVVVLFLT